ncbi:MAG: succinate dehydrogenase cytochrome b subunit [Planctomycetia bacterium]|nr:succinate dehydrogenase cytochrome b subunit [Planctomycetia bacterium]
MKRLIGALGIGWLFKSLSSSIGQKVVMAITGLALCGFLVVHLAGNLLLYAGAEKYNHYAHALHAQEVLLLVAEIGLLVTFLLHIWLALKTDSQNKSARPIEYAVRQSKMDPGPLAVPPSGVMLGTGIVVLAFLLVHLSDFKLFDFRHKVPANIATAQAGGAAASSALMAPFDKAVAILKDNISAVVYFVGSLVLGYHVWHGFESAFQTLGLNHPRYMPLVKFVSLVFALTVGIGFASFPFWALAFH